jgi:hypothetical protein
LDNLPYKYIQQSDAPTQATQREILKIYISCCFLDKLPPVPPYIPPSDNLKEENSPSMSDVIEEESQTTF